MNKIEEILKEYGISDIPFDENITMYYPALLNAVKEFGKICFKAGSELVWKSTGDYSGYESYKYKTYEDFLKEIEDETGN